MINHWGIFLWNLVFPGRCFFYCCVSVSLWNSSRLENPCDGCEAPYGFKNHMALNMDTATFSVSFLFLFFPHQLNFNLSKRNDLSLNLVLRKEITIYFWMITIFLFLGNVVADFYAFFSLSLVHLMDFYCSLFFFVLWEILRCFLWE